MALPEKGLPPIPMVYEFMILFPSKSINLRAIGQSLKKTHTHISKYQ
jgi:hypothetical protein